MNKKEIGSKIGKWTIVSNPFYPIGKTKNSKYVKCRCDCGTESNVRISSLGRDSFKCKKCSMSETNSSRKNLINREFEFMGDVVKMIISNKYEVLYDLKYHDEVSKIKWRIVGGYVLGQLKDGSTIRLHRYIKEFLKKDIIPINMEVDHINRNRLDNREENLNIVTGVENSENKVASKKNTSGFVGVSWNKTLSKWESRITHNKVLHRLGYFDNKEDAIVARKEAELKYCKYKIKIGAIQ